jgi:hypothetical protein
VSQGVDHDQPRGYRIRYRLPKVASLKAITQHDDPPRDHFYGLPLAEGGLAEPQENPLAEYFYRRQEIDPSA